MAYLSCCLSRVDPESACVTGYKNASEIHLRLVTVLYSDSGNAMKYRNTISVDLHKLYEDRV